MSDIKSLIMNLHENTIVDWISAQGLPHDAVECSIGDDAAVLRPEHRRRVISTDMLLDGVHFNTHLHPAELIGRKSLAVNLSDLAAMGALPEAAFISLALPEYFDQEWLKLFYEGVLAIARKYDCSIAGGDTNVWDGKFCVNVAISGIANSPILRSTAQAGDWIMVTGDLGGSIYGRHLKFEPRVHEAQQLINKFRIKAMMDISDGLGTDALRLAKQSKIAIDLLPTQIPIHQDVRHLHAPSTWLRHALCDGEDFELCFAVSPEVGADILAHNLSFKVTHIGNCRNGEGVYQLINEETHILDFMGYEHGTPSPFVIT